MNDLLGHLDENIDTQATAVDAVHDAVHQLQAGDTLEEFSKAVLTAQAALNPASDSAKKLAEMLPAAEAIADSESIAAAQNKVVDVIVHLPDALRKKVEERMNPAQQAQHQEQLAVAKVTAETPAEEAAVAEVVTENLVAQVEDGDFIGESKARSILEDYDVAEPDRMVAKLMIAIFSALADMMPGMNEKVQARKAKLMKPLYAANETTRKQLSQQEPTNAEYAMIYDEFEGGGELMSVIGEMWGAGKSEAERSTQKTKNQTDRQKQFNTFMDGKLKATNTARATYKAAFDGLEEAQKKDFTTVSGLAGSPGADGMGGGDIDIAELVTGKAELNAEGFANSTKLMGEAELAAAESVKDMAIEGAENVGNERFDQLVQFIVDPNTAAIDIGGDKQLSRKGIEQAIDTALKAKLGTAPALLSSMTGIKDKIVQETLDATAKGAKETLRKGLGLDEAQMKIAKEGENSTLTLRNLGLRAVEVVATVDTANAASPWKVGDKNITNQQLKDLIHNEKSTVNYGTFGSKQPKELATRFGLPSNYIHQTSSTTGEGATEQKVFDYSVEADATLPNVQLRMQAANPTQLGVSYREGTAMVGPVFMPVHEVQSYLAGKPNTGVQAEFVANKDLKPLFTPAPAVAVAPVVAEADVPLEAFGGAGVPVVAPRSAPVVAPIVAEADVPPEALGETGTQPAPTLAAAVSEIQQKDEFAGLDSTGAPESGDDFMGV